jgi:hypothetical protein
MENGPERSEPVSTPLGLGGFDSFRAARERFFSTLTEASVIARLEAVWDDSESDRTTDGHADAMPEVG